MNDKSDKNERCINLDYLNKRTKSNPALMIEIISIFLKQTPPLVKIMTQGLKAKDCHSLYHTVHKMIPSFSIMGISPDFENMAKKIQEFTGKKEFPAEIEELVLQLENICTQACKELNVELNLLKNFNI